MEGEKEKERGEKLPSLVVGEGSEGGGLMVRGLFLPPFPSLPSKHNPPPHPPTSHLKGVAAEFKLFYVL